MDKPKFVEVSNVSEKDFEERINTLLEDGYELFNSGMIFVLSRPSSSSSGYIQYWAHLVLK